MTTTQNSNTKFTTAEKIKIATDLFTQFCNGGEYSNNIHQIRELEKKQYCDLQDYMIPLAEIPERYYNFLTLLSYVDSETGEPLSGLHFHSGKFSHQAGITTTTHYITVDGYFYLLLTELELKTRFFNESAVKAVNNANTK